MIQAVSFDPLVGGQLDQLAFERVTFSPSKKRAPAESPGGSESLSLNFAIGDFGDFFSTMIVY